MLPVLSVGNSCKNGWKTTLQIGALSVQDYAINDQHFLHTFSGISPLPREFHPQPMEQIFFSIAAIAQLRKPCKRLTMVLAGLVPEATATLPASETLPSGVTGRGSRQSCLGGGPNNSFPKRKSAIHLLYTLAFGQCDETPI